jgi:dTDP-4-amino-4,6-dideoxygalactose transaminase
MTTKYNIPLTKPFLGKDEFSAIKRVLESGMLTEGKETKKLEAKICEYTGAKFAIATNSCTSALHISLLACGIKAGDQVIIPDYTFPSTGNVVKMVGAQPVLCDVDTSFQLDPQQIEPLITDRTKVLLVVDEFGSTADMDHILEVAEKHNLVVIEDAAPSLGSLYKNKMAGTFGLAGCYSFHPRKIITCGEGGAVVTNNEELMLLLRGYKNNGSIKSGFFISGLNYRLSDINSAILNVQFKRLEALIFARYMRAKYYYKLIEEEGLQNIMPPIVSEDVLHTYQSFVTIINHKHPKDVRRRLRSKGIEVQIGAYSLSKLLPFTFCKQGPLYMSHQFSEHALTLPLYPHMHYTDQEIVIKELKKEIG